MRISNNTMINRSLRDINANKVRVANAERDISTGVRIHRGSDDPTQDRPAPSPPALPHHRVARDRARH